MMNIFQFSPSREGGPSDEEKFRGIVPISILALTGGRSLKNLSNLIAGKYFNSRPHGRAVLRHGLRRER